MALLSLPTELLHEVYDRLEVADRLALNIALPPPHRVRRTRRTSLEADRALHAMSRALKRMPPDRRAQLMSRRGPLRRLMAAHAADPTVRALAEEAPRPPPPDGPALPGPGPERGGDADRLLAALEAGDAAALRGFSAGTASRPPVGRAETELADSGREIVEALRERGFAPELVGAVLADPGARGVFCAAVAATAPFGPRIRLFDLLNHRRFDVVDLLRASGDAGMNAAFGTRDEDVREFVGSKLPHLFCGDSPHSAAVVRFIMDRFGERLSAAQVDAMLEAAAGNAAVEAAEAILNLFSRRHGAPGGEAPPDAP